MQAKRKISFVSKIVRAGLFLSSTSSVLVNAGNYVVAWNATGPVNVPTAATNVQAIAAGNGLSLALKADGTVVAWGRAGTTNIPAAVSNVVAIAAGNGQGLALKNDGTLAAWGAPSTVATTNIPDGLSNIVAIACGDDHNLVLRSDGTIYAWGANYSGQTNIPAAVSNVAAIAAGNSGNIAVKRDGTVWVSGSYYPTNVITSFSNSVGGALVAGSYQGVVLSGDGAAYAWGFNGTNVTAISNVTAVAGRSPINQAGCVWTLRRDGTLTGLGGSYLGQSNVWMNLSNVLAIAAGNGLNLAIVGDSLPLPIEPMLNAGFNNGQFVISQPTSLGRSYRLEYKNSLTDDWQMFPPTPGNGSLQILADPNPPASQRFYHIYAGQ
jgi:hypothetical protein